MNPTKRALGGAAVAAAAGALVFSATPVVAAPYLLDASLSLSKSAASCEGGSLSVSGQDFGAGEDIALDLHSTVVRLNVVRADANGDFDVSVTLPTDISGQHYIEGTGQTTGRTARADILFPDNCGEVGGVDLPDDDGDTGNGNLPNTGAAVAGIGALGLALVGGGVVLTRVRRRRNSS
ncbi:MAG TPA: LPXTG cell wall anchor domain-containing protein [Sporichthya sp.]|nr:LPXTG cell wall anchor domain-containing protein [Sporichthya sp.]